VAIESVSVPLSVTGEPVTENIEGALSPTLLTVPPPLPLTAAQVPSPRRNVVADGVPVAAIADTGILVCANAPEITAVKIAKTNTAARIHPNTRLNISDIL
jgi:hypothetical protein